MHALAQVLQLLAACMRATPPSDPAQAAQRDASLRNSKHLPMHRRRLPLTERLTMLPWLYATLDFDATPATYEKYDKMSARDMFRAYGVSRRMYEEFIKPTLLVGLFAPPEELSAGATMGMLYYYGAYRCCAWLAAELKDYCGHSAVTTAASAIVKATEACALHLAKRNPVRGVILPLQAI